MCANRCTPTRWTPFDHNYVHALFTLTSDGDGSHSLHSKINVILAFKFYATKDVVLAYNEIYVIKAIPTKYKENII